MANLKYYALCSRNLHSLKRHATIIPKEDLVIVLNAKLDCPEREINQHFLTEGEAYCKAENIEYYITDSDGTPSTGKNSVFDLFKSSDNDYMVLIDGDDFITPHGLWLYDKIAQSDSPPDVIALEYQYGLIPNDGYRVSDDLMYYEKLHLQGETPQHFINPIHVHAMGFRIFMRPKHWWQRALAGKSVDKFDDFSTECSDYHQRIHKIAYDYISNWEPHLRITFYSKKAAEFRMDPNLLVGEDTAQYLHLKHAWHEGDIDLRHLNEIYPTYVYDQRLDGIVKYANERDDGHGWLNWMKALSAEYDTLEQNNKLHSETPPYVLLPDFPEDYKPDTMGLVNFPHKQPKY